MMTWCDAVSLGQTFRTNRVPLYPRIKQSRTGSTWQEATVFNVFFTNFPIIGQLKVWFELLKSSLNMPVANYNQTRALSLILFRVRVSEGQKVVLYVILCHEVYTFLLAVSRPVRTTTNGILKADSHIACRSHAAPLPFPCHAVPLRV